MTLYPNCKINIGLRVVRKREDGYHDLETIFYPVPLCDEMEIIPLSFSEDIKELHTEANTMCSFSMETKGIEVDCSIEDNLIYKCYRLMKEKYPEKIGAVKVRFKKNIPFGAGLGGGSSDATHMAIALNEIFELGLNREEIAQLVRPLGADCPFFAYNEPCFAEGIGDILTPIDFSLTGKRIVMIKPDVHVSTREAYSGLIRPFKGMSNYRDHRHFREFINDFEASVFPLHPELGIIKQRLLDAGAEYAAMTGSGSTIYGIFESSKEKSSNLSGLEQDFGAQIICNDIL